MKKTLGVIIKVMLAVLLFLELINAVTGFGQLNPEINPIFAIFPAIIAIATAIILILFMMGKEKIPILWYYVGSFKILATLVGLYSLGIGDVGIGLGMPVALFYIYIGLHVAMAIVLGFYGWSLSIPTDAEKAAAKKKGRDFNEFVKKLDGISSRE